MHLRGLLHPLPLVLICLFVAVAVVDLVQKLGEDPPPPLELVGSDTARFEADEPVIDLRSKSADPSIVIQPTLDLNGEQWSVPGEWGVWAKGTVAEFSLDLTAGGHRVLLLECAPAPGKRSVRRLRLTINGIDCGETAIEPGWQRCRLALPDGAIRPGANTIVLGFPDREDAKRVRRALAIRRVGLFFDRDVGVESVDVSRQVSLDIDAERVTVRRSGLLEIPLLLEERTDALQMRYRFKTGDGRIDVQVAQAQAGQTGVDEALGQSIDAAEKSSGRIRIPLHGRRGAYVLRIRVNLPTPDSRLLISSLKLVEEGDPTRRPKAANPSLN